MSLLLLVGGLTIFLLLSALVSRSPKIVLYALTAFALTAWDWPVLPALGSVGGASVFAEDAMAGAMVITTLFLPGRFLAAVKPYSFIIMVTAIALAASVLYGVIDFGLKGLSEFRSFLYPLAAVAWALNQDWADEAWQSIMRRWAIVTGLLLSLTAATRFFLYGPGQVDSFVRSVLSGGLQTSRPLTAGQAVLLALCAVYLMQGLGSKTRRDLGWITLFTAVTLAAQHRSVWIALGAALVVLFFKVHGVARARIVVASLVAASTVTVLALSGIFNPFSKQFGESATSLGTYSARTASWTTLVGATFEGGLGSMVFPTPFGAGFKRVENGVYVEWAPHNWYVSVYLRLGLFGLIVFAALLLIVMLRLLRTREVGPAAAAFALILTYCWAYSLTWYAAPFFAWAMWSVSKREPQQVDEKPHLPAAYRAMQSSAPISSATRQSSGYLQPR